MTTIVVYKGWMAADSRYSDGSSILTDYCPKILTREDGLTVAAAGEGAQGNAVMHSPLLGLNWLDGMGPEFPLEWATDETMLGKISFLLHRRGDKELYMSSATRWCDPMPVNREMIGIGSGADFARAACKVLEAESNYPPKKIITLAVEYAISLDINSGGDVQLVRL